MSSSGLQENISTSLWKIHCQHAESFIQRTNMESFLHCSQLHIPSSVKNLILINQSTTDISSQMLQGVRSLIRDSRSCRLTSCYEQCAGSTGLESLICSQPLCPFDYSQHTAIPILYISFSYSPATYIFPFLSSVRIQLSLISLHLSPL